jgi:hypothetical protein
MEVVIVGEEEDEKLQDLSSHELSKLSLIVKS